MENIMHEQWNVRARMDCGKGMLLSAEMVGSGPSVEHVKEVKDPTPAQQGQQAKKSASKWRKGWRKVRTSHKRNNRSYGTG